MKTNEKFMLGKGVREKGWGKGLHLIRIAQITPFAGEWFSGTERYCFQLLKSLTKKHDIHIFTSRLNKDTQPIEEVAGMTICSLRSLHKGEGKFWGKGHLC